MKVFRSILMTFVALGIVGFGLTGLGADYNPGVKVQLIKKATAAANGQALAYPRIANPEVTVVTVEVPPGSETGWHTHPIPVYAYVMSGTLSVTIGSDATRDFQEGDAIIEVVDTPHNGRNQGKTSVKLVVFYTGAVGGQNTVTIPK